MSFSNDEDGDGLAALFGGITPQGTPGEQPGPRRAAATPAAGEPAPAAPEPAPAAPYVAPAAPQPQYPGLAEQQPAPGAYPPPAAAPATPAYEMPAPAAAPAPQAPQAYDLPAPAAPGGATYAPPATSQYPGLAPTPQYPAAPDPAPYQPPAAAPYPGASPYAETPPVPQYPETSAPAPVPSNPAYPPTAQYPAGVDPASYAAPAGPSYEAPAADPPVYQPPAYDAPPASAPPASAPPAYEPPSYAAPPPAYEPPTYDAPRADEPPPADEPSPAYEPPPFAAPSVAEQPTYAAPPPVVEPPAFTGFEALGLQPTDTGGPEPSAAADPPPAERAFVEQPRAEEQPAQTSYGEHPIVRAEAAPLASVFPPGPLLPVPAEGRDDESEDLARSTVLEKVGLALAVLAGPIGLLLAIVTAIRGVRRRGWVIGIGRASLVFGVLSTIVFAIGGYALWNMRLDQLQHDQVAAASAEFCAAGDADPSLVTPPTLGWPREGETITDSLALMQAWTDNWRALAATSPAELRDGMNLLAERGGVIIDAVTASRSVDDAANQQQISSIEAQSGVSSWYVTYCMEP